MTRGQKKVYEGKAKILFEGPEPGTLIQHFKDDATAFNAEKHDVIAGKGVLNNRISGHIMTLLQNAGISTHFIKTLNMREQLIRKVEVIPVEVVVRNIAAGSLVKRLGIEEGRVLPRPLVEHYYKDDALGDPMINEDHIVTFEWAQPAELEEIYHAAIRINDFLMGLLAGVGLKLVDLKLEFGRFWETEDTLRIVLADEISPDNCRIWDARTGEKLDKDRFRFDLGDLIESYQDIAHRLGVMTEEEFQQALKSNGNGNNVTDITGTEG